MNEKMIDKKLKDFDEQVNKFNKKLTEQLSDILIDNEISMLSSIPDDQIRKRRTSRPRIILNRRSDSLSMPREKAKINLKKNLNRHKKLVKDLRSIEIKDFDTNDLKAKETTNKIVKKSNVKDKKKEHLTEKMVKTKTNKILNLINKAKIKHTKRSTNKNSTNSKDNKSIKPFKLERSRSQEEFSNLKNKRKSRFGRDLEQVGCKLVNRQLYSRELLMNRAKRKTLKMTALIVFAFL